MMRLQAALFIGLCGLLLPGSVLAASTVITLTQVPCQFLETEPANHHFVSTQASDCKKINADTGDKRLAVAKTLRLKPGDYTFRVTNKNVPYILGFYLRPASLLDRIRLPSISGGGIEPGGTKDYHIKLIEGDYLFSCPLNPTPDYKIVVSN